MSVVSSETCASFDLSNDSKPRDSSKRVTFANSQYFERLDSPDEEKMKRHDEVLRMIQILKFKEFERKQRILRSSVARGPKRPSREIIRNKSIVVDSQIDHHKFALFSIFLMTIWLFLGAAAFHGVERAEELKICRFNYEQAKLRTIDQVKRSVSDVISSTIVSEKDSKLNSKSVI